MNIANVRIKRCWVCGDKATGFNYEALSCESCKVFFHRNAAKSKALQCRKVNACPIDIATRKSCSKCRVEKCFTIGMKWRSSDIAKELNSRYKKPPESLNGRLSELLGSIQDKQISPNSHSIRSLLEDDTEAPAAAAAVATSTERSDNNQKPSDSSDDSNGTPPEVAIVPEIFVRRKKYATYLNSHERNLIAELQTAMSIFEDENNLKLVGETDNLYTVITSPVFYMRRIVRFARSFPTFKCLSQTDQLTILRAFCFDFLSIRFIYLYSVEKNGHLILADELGDKALFVKCNESQFKYTDLEMMNENKKYTIEMQSQMENDPTLRDLIIAQLLFKPREQLACPEYIQYQYSLYCRLLRRYLENKHSSVCLANRKFATLMRHLDGLTVMRENCRRFFSESLDLSQMSHILLEIYDI